MEVMDMGDFPAQSAVQQRLVHLDLKGAPPKINYYEKIFPLLSKWGATGLLVEYEDTFPFSANYKDIAAPNCYSVEDITTLQTLAKVNNLIIIPLVQTFGHFEFVLKHEKFRHLREIPPYPMALCPLQPESLSVVSDMIDQVIELHPDIKWFHIGADEVFHLGLCERCVQHMKENSLTKTQLFFKHIRPVLEHIHQKYPNIRPIMWDDMFREAHIDTLKGSGLTDLVDPMVWIYSKGPFSLSPDFWDRYSAVFNNIWVASAFKGATGPCMYYTDIDYHIGNHKEWLQVANCDVLPKCKMFQGYCLTGWQRYDHYSILCELLPAALPSLAMCLLTLSEGGFSDKVHKQATTDLSFTDLIPLNPLHHIDRMSACSFPGSGIYCGIQMLILLKEEYHSFTKMDRIKGWMNPYHVKHRYSNPVHIEHFLPGAQQLLHGFRQLEHNMKVALAEVFQDDTVDEWICSNFESDIEDLVKTVTNAQIQVAHGATPKSYPDGFPGKQ